MTGLRERLILEVNILRCTRDDDADPMSRGGSESQLWHTLSASQVADWFLAAIEEEDNE